MNPFITRVLSAIVAILIVVSLVYFLGDNGLRILCLIAPFVAQRELSRILFSKNEGLLLKWSFSLGTLIIFCISALYPQYGAVSLALVTVLFCSLSLNFENKFQDLQGLVMFLAKSHLGFIYIGLLPAVAFHLINLPNGNVWFLTLLASVLLGDTFAYLVGTKFGKKPFSPRISPKKSVEGSYGGLLGSGIAGALSGFFFLTDVSILFLCLVCLLAGFVAQQGDLFESLLKRVANRKDSGSIMPGHGGILDRIDGILFGAPIFLGAALLQAYLF